MFKEGGAPAGEDGEQDRAALVFQVSYQTNVMRILEAKSMITCLKAAGLSENGMG
jgi:hypothetical protein